LEQSHPAILSIHCRQTIVKELLLRSPSLFPNLV
jgi:hypothetical protein